MKLFRQTNEALDRGATAVEYAITASLIAAVIAFMVGYVGLDALANFESIGW